MSQSNAFIAFPREADRPSTDQGEYYAIHIGLATGVYPEGSWSTVRGLVMSRVPRQQLDCDWRKFQSWNQACWFADNGLKLEQTSFYPMPMARPPRKVQPAEILSQAYPVGSTIVLESSDELLPYLGRTTLPITVSVIRRNSMGVLPSPPPSQNQPTYDVRASLSSQQAASATRSLPSSHFVSGSFRGGIARGSSSQKTKEHYSSPTPTLAGSDSCSPTPVIEDVGANPFLSPVSYQTSTYVASSSRANVDSQSPERGGNRWPNAQPSGSQQSASSSQPDIVAAEGRRRLNAFRTMRHVDADIEARITAYVLVRMLDAANLSPEELDEVADAVNALQESMQNTFASPVALVPPAPQLAISRTMSDYNSTAQSTPPDPRNNPQLQLNPSSSPQPTNNAPGGLVSKRRVQRDLERLVSGKAVEIDTEMRGKINEVAEGLGVAPETLAQKFAIVAPIGETRKPMWWNGLVAEKTEEWRDQYKGPGRGLLPYVTARMRDENLKENTTLEERERLEKKARETRVSNKAQKAAAMTRAKALKAAQEKIESIYEELQQLHGQLGIEFALFATRSSFCDDMDPLYLSSDKAKLFFQGHLNIPPKELLKLMDMSVITGVGGMSAAVANQKETHRQGVRTKLNASYCSVLKSLGHDISNFRHISYKNYDELVRRYHIVLRGYPLTPEGCIVGPSDFPGGIPGLAHAEKQLESGKWGFEKIQESTYNDWMVECNNAKDNDRPMPLPPHISAPGTEFIKPLKKQKATGSDGPKPKSRKRSANNDSPKEGEQEGVRPKSKAKRGEGSRSTFKSREVIEDSDSEQESTGGR